MYAIHIHVIISKESNGQVYSSVYIRTYACVYGYRGDNRTRRQRGKSMGVRPCGDDVHRSPSTYMVFDVWSLVASLRSLDVNYYYVTRLLYTCPKNPDVSCGGDVLAADNE